jgi:very-short-patch-repair endonuclease
MVRTRKLDGTGLATTLRKQFGVISRQQALACGVTRAALQHRLRAGGPWQKLLPGVYLAATGVATADQHDMAALLYAGHSSLLTGPAALRRHAIRGPDTQVVDVLVPLRTERQSTGFFRVHRSARLPAQLCVIGEIRFAMIARAVADAARGLDSLNQVRAVVAGVVQARRCPLDLLVTELNDGPARGSALLRVALAEVAGGVRSVAEADFRDLLRRARLPMPMFNARLFDGDTLIAVADCWWRDAGVVAEVDSREWHLSPADWERTMRRHAELSARGVIVLHFTPHQIKAEPQQVVATIESALAAGSARPRLPIRALPPAD